MNPLKISIRRLAAPLVLAACALAAGSAAAAFPDRPITIVVPYAPGGAADTVARLMAAKLSAQLGTSVIVDNRAGGSGTVQRLAAELFRQSLKLDMVHVPYKSGGPAITHVMGGQVDFMFATVAATYPLISSGKLRALTVSSPERSARLPSVPTVAETVIPGYEAFEWNGMLVPAKTPKDVVDKLQKAVAEVLKQDEVQKRLQDLGAKPVGSTPQEFATFLKKEDAKWGEVIRKGNIQLD